MHAGAQIDEALWYFYQGSEEVRGEHVDGKDVLETIDSLDSAFAVTHSGVVNDGVEPS